LPTDRKGVESNSSMHSLNIAQAALKVSRRIVRLTTRVRGWMRRLWTLALRDQRISLREEMARSQMSFCSSMGEVRESERFRSFLEVVAK
jgi:hypothetical protein